MQRSLTLLLCVIAALSLPATGCRPETASAREMLPAPPYERTDGGRLRVRDDLVPLLRFSRAARSDVRATLQGFGRVAFAPGASYAVRSAVSAYVERVFVNVGQTVASGTPLAVLRSPEIARARGEQRRYQLDLAVARDEVQRLERMVPAGAASERELVAARSRVAAIQSDLASAAGVLASAGATGGVGDAFTLRATAPGQVIERSIDPGERVDPSGAEAAFLVGDPAAVQVRAAFPEREAPMLVEGAPCTFVVSALGADRYEGEVSQVVHAIDPSTHTASAICRPRVRDPRLRAEMVARVEIEARGAPSVLIPRGALLLHREERVVFVRRAPSELERRVLEAGLQFGDQIQVLRGLDAGEEVVSENAVLLDGELDRLL